MDQLIDWLEKSDFFTAPASTRFHSNFEGGLAEHSYLVYQLLDMKNVTFNLGLSKETIIITSLLHDICKVNFYEKQIKWRKDKNNKWESYETYGYNDTFPVGHGEKSVIVLQRFIELTDIEVYLIRFHMGAFLDGENLKAYYQATEIEPRIVAMHTSDYEASKFLEKKVEV